jgi:cyclopropane-fatty-acyl-phospholipid synthase
MEKHISRNAATIGSLDGPRRLQFGERILSRWLRNIAVGRLTVEFPSGARRTFEGPKAGPNATLWIRNRKLVFRILVAGDIGFAEGYMAGDWDTPDLAALLKFCGLNIQVLSKATGGSPLVRVLTRLRHVRNANTRRGSRRNIGAHYDLGNDFYRFWLDETMTYSSGIFENLEAPMIKAQQRKYLRMAELLDLQPGDRVLEIGCGWGGFAEVAAREFDCNVVCLTLSREQAAYARERIASAGLGDRVEIRIQDYRDVEGEFDKIASIEMFEAVGEAYWPTYLEILGTRLKRGGRAALQVITIAEERFEAYRRNPDFIQRYIFPGGMLPGPEVFESAVQTCGLAITDAFYFGKSYAETVRRWDRSFQANWPSIERLGFDRQFFRMWRYYLGYCEAGFDTGQINVGQFLIEHR